MKIKSYFFVGFIKALLSIMLVNAQQVQLNGKILEINSGRKPIPNAQIKSDNGANAVKSDTKGEYTLIFQDQGYGALVYVEAQKEGYELVNEKAMQLFLPEAKENQKINLEIILCKQGYLDQARIKYYEITDKYIKAEFQRRYDQIIAQKKEGWQKERVQLQEKMDKLEEQLKKQVEDYIRTNRDELTEKELLALKLFEEGKLDESLKIRASMNSEEELRKELENERIAKENERKSKIEREEAKRAAQNHRRNLRAEANGYILKFEFDKAEKKLKALATIDSQNINSVFEYALFLKTHSKYKEAINYFEGIIQILNVDKKYEESYSIKAKILTQLGESLNLVGKYEEAINNFNQAIELESKSLRSRISFDNDESVHSISGLKNSKEESGLTSRSTLIDKINNELFLSYLSLKDYANALDCLERIKKTYKSFYGGRYDVLYLDYAHLFIEQKKYDSAYAYLKKSKSFREKLPREKYINNNKNTYRLVYDDSDGIEYDGKYYYYSSIVSHELKNYKESIEFHKKALLTIEKNNYLKLVTNISTWSNIQNSLGLVYLDIKNYNEAENRFLKAINTYDSIIPHNPDLFVKAREMATNNLVKTYKKSNNYHQIENVYLKFIELKEKFNLNGLSSLKNKLGLYYKNQNKFLKAEHYFIEALKHQIIESENSLTLHQNDIDSLKANILDFYLTNRKTLREKLSYNGVNMYLYNKEHQDLIKKSYILNNLSEFYIELLTKHSDITNNIEAINISKNLLSEFSGDNWKNDVIQADLNFNLSHLYTTDKKYDKAISAAITSNLIYKSLLKDSIKEDEEFDLDYLSTNSFIGSIYIDKKEYEQAIEYLKQTIESIKQYKDSNIEKYNTYLLSSLYTLGDLYIYLNDLESSVVYFKEFVNVSRQLEFDSANNNVARALNNLGSLYSFLKNYELALINYNESLLGYTQLANLNPEKYEIEVARIIVLIGLLQRDFNKGININGEELNLKLAETILQRYKNNPYSVNLNKSLVDLKLYFSAFNLLQETEALEKSKENLELDEIVDVQENIISKYIKIHELGYDFSSQLGRAYGSLAWNKLFVRDFVGAEQASRKAINPDTFKKSGGYDQEIEWVNTNLALALLFQGKFEKAKEIYMRLKNKPYGDATYKEVFLADLEALEKEGITHPDVAKIRKLLNHD